MRSVLAALCLFATTAHAVPAQFTHQGRLLDADGTPLEGEATLTFRVTDSETGGTVLWEETLTLPLNGGFYAAVLGSDEDTNPLDADVLSQAPVWLEVQLAGEAAMSPRSAIHAVPYATMATVAEEVSGGPVDASQIAVAGTPVVNESGEWVGPAPTVNWTDIEGMPDGFADDTDNDTDSFATLGESCLDGDIPVWDAVAMSWDCDMDMDTLAATVCADGQTLVYTMATGAWDCGTDSDTTLSSEEVRAMVEAVSGLALQSGATVDGSGVLTAASHGDDEHSHHSATSDGLHITPASVALSGSDTQLVDGEIDLGSEGDDALTASMVQTLTGGGDADTLHTHAASSGGGGWSGISFLGVTTIERSADATYEVMEDDCATAFGRARMCRMSQMKNVYPAPRPDTQSWVLIDFQDNPMGVRWEDATYTTEFGYGFDGIGQRHRIRNMPGYGVGTNCTSETAEGLFVTTTDPASSTTLAYYRLPAVTVLPSGRLTRVSCDNAFTVACCGPQ